MFLNDRAIDVSEVKFFVLDEADRILDQGLMPDVREIVSKMPPKVISKLFFDHFVMKMFLI